jgi:hypothetical protein
VEAAKDQITLEQLSVGARLVVRSRTEWRFAAIARIDDERIVLTVCSPSGHTYRLRREKGSEIFFEGRVPILPHLETDSWQENFASYDARW